MWFIILYTILMLFHCRFFLDSCCFMAFNGGWNETVNLGRKELLGLCFGRCSVNRGVGGGEGELGEDRRKMWEHRCVENTTEEAPLVWGLWMKVEVWGMEHTSPQTRRASCQGVTEHDAALITHMLKCMARTCCLCMAFQASVCRGPSCGDKPELQERPRRATASLAVQTVSDALPAMPSPQHWAQPLVLQQCWPSLPFVHFSLSKTFIFSPGSLFCLGRKGGTAPRCNCMADTLPPPQKFDAAAVLPEKCQLSNQPVTSQQSCFIFCKEPSF